MSILRPGVIKQHKPNQTLLWQKLYYEQNYCPYDILQSKILMTILLSYGILNLQAAFVFLQALID